MKSDINDLCEAFLAALTNAGYHLQVYLTEMQRYFSWGLLRECVRLMWSI